MAEFSPPPSESWTILPSFARKTNPIDLTGQVNSVPTMLKDACETVAADPQDRAIIVQFASTVRRHLLANKEVFKAMAREVPVFLSIMGETSSPELRKELRDAGVLLCGDPSAAMKALSLLYRRRDAMRLPALPKREAAARASAPGAWADMMQFCGDSGVTPAKWVVLGPQDRAAKAARSWPIRWSSRFAFRRRAQDRDGPGQAARAVGRGSRCAGAAVPPAHGQAAGRHPGAGDGGRRCRGGACLPAQFRFRPGDLHRHGRRRDRTVSRRDLPGLAGDRCRTGADRAAQAEAMDPAAGISAAKPQPTSTRWRRAAVRFGDLFLARESFHPRAPSAVRLSAFRPGRE
jgi:hypothetical protein